MAVAALTGCGDPDCCASTSRPLAKAYVLRVPSNFMIALAAGT
jgi:hypothetical protein